MTAAKAILNDTTRCTGCEKCVSACKRENGLAKDLPRRWKLRIDDLSSTRFTTIQRREDGRPVRRMCLHCLEPACVSACIVGALQKRPDGPVIYDGDRCMGCRYCMMACPFGIPRYEWEQPVPYVRKCILCYHRLDQGKLPACVEACPEKATIFGDRDQLLAEAERRIRDQPARYRNTVFGRDEVGGTSVLYVSDLDLGFLSWKPDLEAQALPDLTWAALGKVPTIVLTMGGLMTGAWWLIGRRNKLAAEAAAAKEQETAAPAVKPKTGEKS
ncbi:MAG: 4Fe-4S dicluster domain-containing protein [Deltaproteobacteria bacterium]|nr:4Fe-4S dicluster domain-containing protein [Deltaproteobacteria bacterium]